MVIPDSIIAANIAPFVADRETFNALSVCNRSVFRLLREDPQFLPPWPRQGTRQIRIPSSGGENEIRSVTVSRCGSLIALGCENGAISIWDNWLGNRAGRGPRVLHEQDEAVPSIFFSTDDDRLMASASYDYSVCLWHLASHRGLVSGEETDVLLGKFRVHEWGVWSVVLLPRSSNLFFDGSEVQYGDKEQPENSISFISSSTSGVVKLTTVCFNGGNSETESKNKGSHVPRFAQCKKILGGNIANPKCSTTTLHRNTVSIQYVEFHSYDGSSAFVFCSEECIFMTFMFHDTSPKYFLHDELESEINGVRVSDDGALLATAFEQKRYVLLQPLHIAAKMAKQYEHKPTDHSPYMILWDLPERMTIGHDAPVNSIEFERQTSMSTIHRLVSADDDGAIRVWEMHLDDSPCGFSEPVCFRELRTRSNISYVRFLREGMIVSDEYERCFTFWDMDERAYDTNEKQAKRLKCG